MHVGFFTGRILLSGVVVVIPYWHMCNRSFSALVTFMTLSTLGSAHEVACCGCSCKKYLWSRACSMYNPHKNSRCALACCILSTLMCAGIRGQFTRIIWQKSRHITEPMRTVGRSRRIRALACRCITRWERSHGLPNSSPVVRSMDEPPFNPNLAAWGATRGPLYTSVTSTLL